MRYNIVINQLQCVKYQLNQTQGALMDLIGQLNTWADDEKIDGKLYYNLAYSKVIEELPLFFGKKDTVYRASKVLEDLGLIEVLKVGSFKKNYVRLTPKGKMFFSVGNKSVTQPVTDLNPIGVGNKSETQKSSLSVVSQSVIKSVTDLNPTYNNNTTNNKHKEGVSALKLLANTVGIYFGKTTEEQQMKVYGFLKSISNISEFKKQFEAYKKYKATSKEKIHRFESFCSEWNQQDWNVLLKKVNNDLNDTPVICFGRKQKIS